MAIPAEQLHAIVATMLLTGGRKAEVLGLAVEDVSFDGHTVTFRPRPWRRLKTATNHRTVPLWPQLEEILRAYVLGGEGPRGRLLFPSNLAEKEQPIQDVRKALDTVGERAWAAGEIRTKMFRHTYCAARLQTLDRGAPVSPFTVARELGHGGQLLVDRVYGHLGDVRQRLQVVAYRIEEHSERMGIASQRGRTSLASGARRALAPAHEIGHLGCITPCATPLRYCILERRPPDAVLPAGRGDTAI